MNRSFTSHTTALSGSENPIVRHRHKVEPYVSPFILNAKRKAEERAKLARMKLKKKQSPVRNEWDQTPSNTGLFDPTIRKQEIFRLGPRNAEQPLAEQRPSSNRDQYDDENHPQRITRAIPTSHSKPQQQRSSALPPSSSSSTNRPHHYMTPRNEILPIHQASHSHSHSNPNDTQRQGKLTMKTTATTPNRAPVAYSNRQPQRQHNARSLLQQRPSQQPTPATATEHKPHRPNEIYTPYDHHEDLLYPKSPGQSLQGQSNIDSQQLSINPKVERSTSPVNETVAEMILKNEPQVKNVDQYQMLVPNESVGVMQQTPHKMTATAVMHHPQESLNAESNQPNLPNSMNNPIFRDPRYIETTEPLDRAQDMHGYYKQLIRERLKTLWQKHRGDPSEGEDDEIEGQPMRPRIPINRSKGKFKGIPFHAVPHGHDSQIYMRDMMASMAQIMTAVGEIVTSNAQSSHKDRRSKNRRRNGRSMSAATINDNVQFVPSTETNNFVLEMAQAMNPFAKQNLPKRKSEVIDLVLQKLQVIYLCCHHVIMTPFTTYDSLGH